MTPGNKILKRIEVFPFNGAVHHMQPTLTLHCSKLVQNINMRISCDERVYTILTGYLDQVDGQVLIFANLKLSLRGQQSLLIPQ